MRKASSRAEVVSFEQIPNVGSSIADDFRSIGMESPEQLVGHDPLKIYQAICDQSGSFHDPCVLDVVMSAVDFMNGAQPKKWWDYTKQRKSNHTDFVNRLRQQYAR